jgi:DNA modification methylase
VLQDVRKSGHFNASTQGEGKNGPVDGLGTISGPSPTRIDDIVNGLFVGHAVRVLADFPDNCIDCVISSPPYFGAVSYNGGGCPWPSHDAYFDGMQSVWRQCGRVLRPNGKLCINAPIMPSHGSVLLAFNVDLAPLAELGAVARPVWEKLFMQPQNATATP